MLQFRRRGYEMVDWICDYHSRVEGLPTRSQVPAVADQTHVWARVPASFATMLEAHTKHDPEAMSPFGMARRRSSKLTTQVSETRRLFHIHIVLITLTSGYLVVP